MARAVAPGDSVCMSMLAVGHDQCLPSWPAASDDEATSACVGLEDTVGNDVAGDEAAGTGRDGASWSMGDGDSGADDGRPEIASPPVTDAGTAANDGPDQSACDTTEPTLLALACSRVS